MLKFDREGLIPAVIQDEENGQVLMVGFLNEEALSLTRTTGFTHLYSRSRQKIWRKGEESGHVQEVRGIYINCEENSLLLKVVQHGPGACHTGHRSCYYRLLLPDNSYEIIDEQVFDPAEVYTNGHQGTGTMPVISQLPTDQQQIELKLRQLYNLYLRLRDEDLKATSNTSRLLHERNIEHLAGRLADELSELAGVQAGTHVHKGRKEDTVLEGHQVGYWLFLLAASLDLSYDDIWPHDALLSGYNATSDTRPEQTREIVRLVRDEGRAEHALGLALGFAAIGRACKTAKIGLAEPIEYDLAEMKKKGLIP